MKAMAIAIVSSALMAAPVFAADQSWSGAISDSICTMKHTMSEHGKALSDRDCTVMCTGHGGQYVLLVGDKVYKLRNHDADLKKHAGDMVTITGELQKGGDTIRVSKIS